MSAKHTPGPWAYHLDDDTNTFSIYTDPRKVGYGQWIAEVRGTKGAYKANALLIAAAPDLLAACEAAETWFSGSVLSPMEQSIVDRLRAAIAKAEPS